MNQALQSGQPDTGGRRFVLEMLGFAEAEKSMLASTFRLSARRPYLYAEAAARGERPDIYLVNADSGEGLIQLEKRGPNVHAPAVLVGRAQVESGWPLIARPIHWMRLFGQLDAMMQSALAARERRRQAGASGWDGRSLRRAADRNAVAASVVLPPASAESVLVVDDSATVRAFMRMKLAPFRFHVDFAENGEAALDMAQGRSYSCIFLDVLMPGMDGYQVCRRIKSSPASKHTAVVMLSSKASAFDRFRGTWAGCDAYLCKPVGEGELLAAIARFLPEGARRDEIEATTYQSVGRVSEA